MYIYMYVYMYVMNEYHSAPSKHPPPFVDDPKLYMYMLCMYVHMASLCKHPSRFGPVSSKRAWALILSQNTAWYIVHIRRCIHAVPTLTIKCHPIPSVCTGHAL